MAPGTRVATPAGFAATVNGTLPESGHVQVTLDKGDEIQTHPADALTKLSTTDSVQARAGIVPPRAWTMGGRVD